MGRNGHEGEASETPVLLTLAPGEQEKLSWFSLAPAVGPGPSPLASTKNPHSLHGNEATANLQLPPHGFPLPENSVHRVLLLPELSNVFEL